MAYLDDHKHFSYRHHAFWNKSTACGAIYARSSVIFPHCMAFVWGRLCSEEGGKTKSEKKKKKHLWKGGGGGGGNPTTLTVSSLVSEFVNFDKEAKSD